MIPGYIRSLSVTYLSNKTLNVYILPPVYSRLGTMKLFSLLLAVIATLTSAIPQLQVQGPNDSGSKDLGRFVDIAVETPPRTMNIRIPVNRVTCDRMSLLPNYFFLFLSFP